MIELTPENAQKVIEALEVARRFVESQSTGKAFPVMKKIDEAVVCLTDAMGEK